MPSAPVFETDFSGLKLHARGKVRDVYAAGDYLVIVASDRLSAFDYILPTPIPDKGRVLTQLTVFWLDLLRDIVPNHFVSADVADYPKEFHPYREQLEGRSMLVRRADMVELECVARGYISGSGWKDYKQERHASAASGFRRVCMKATSCRSRSSLQRRKPKPATMRTSLSSEAAKLVGERCRRPAARFDPRHLQARVRVRRNARHHHRRHEVRVRLPGRTS